MYAFYAVKANIFGKARKESILLTMILTMIQSKLHPDHLFPEISLEAFQKENSKSFTSGVEVLPSCPILSQLRVVELFS